jgi:hypothetical protein
MVAPVSTAEIPDSVLHGDNSLQKDLIPTFIVAFSCVDTHHHKHGFRVCHGVAWWFV